MKLLYFPKSNFLKFLLEKDQIVLTTPCSHFICSDCDRRFYRLWRDEGKEPKTDHYVEYYSTIYLLNLILIIFLNIYKHYYLFGYQSMATSRKIMTQI